MQSDGAAQSHEVAPGTVLKEVRYRLRIPVAPEAASAGAPAPRTGRGRAARLVVLGLAAAGAAFALQFALTSSRRPIVVANPPPVDPALEHERRAAQRQVQVLLRPQTELKAGVTRGPDSHQLRRMLAADGQR